MAMRNTAAGFLRVRRPEVASAAVTTGRRFLAALSAEKERARTEAASAAASSGRRFLSGISAEDRKMTEDEVERRVRASMELHFDTRVKAIVRSEVKEIVRSEAADVNSGLDTQLLLENASTKQALSFQEELFKQRLKFEEKIEALVKKQDNAADEMNALIEKLKNQCGRRADIADNKFKLLSQTHANFKESSNAAVQRTQYNLMKVVGGGVSFAAIGTLCYYLFH